MDEKEAAEVLDIQARTAQTYIDSGVLLPEEERGRLAGDEQSPYQGLDLSLDVAPPPGEGGDLLEASEPSDEPADREDAEDAA